MLQMPHVVMLLVSCRQQAEVVESNENENVRSTGQGEAENTKYKGLNKTAAKHQPCK